MVLKGRGGMPRKREEGDFMAFGIVRNDITHMRVDAIVNTANPRPVIGSGTDAGIHAKAGPELLEARKAIGSIRPGTCAITPGFGLDAKYVIHTVGPVWRGGIWGEAKVLRSCYESALALAAQHGCRSVAFPLISAGNYGFPRDKAMQIAVSACSEFLLERDMEIWLVVFDGDSFLLSEKLFRDVASYIDENYVEQALHRQYGREPREERLRRIREDCRGNVPPESWGYTQEKRGSVVEGMPEARAPRRAPLPPQSAKSMDVMLEELDAGFSETLLKLIDRSGKKDSEIYNRANVSRQHFSKIRNNPAYKPTKATAIAFAIALELDMEQTRDLLGRAGYALTRSSKFDVIIMYFIEHRNYDLYDINTTLYEFDQSLLGV